MSSGQPLFRVSPLSLGDAELLCHERTSPALRLPVSAHPPVPMGLFPHRALTVPALSASQVPGPHPCALGASATHCDAPTPVAVGRGAGFCRCVLWDAEPGAHTGRESSILYCEK